MEKTVNQRIAEIKSSQNLGTNEFAQKAGIAPGTVWNIENDGNVSLKTLKAISIAFNVNLEWLKTGKGKMYLPAQTELKNEAINPWRDALVTELKEEVSYLRELLKMSMSGKSANFRKALDRAAIPYHLLKQGVGSSAFSYK